MITTRQAAQIFGVSLRRIEQLQKEGVLDRPKPAHVSCEKLAAMLAKEREAMTEDEADYEADKARKMKADADLAELVAAKEGGKLVEIKKIERRWANALSGLRGKCMAMPARIGPMVVIAKSAGDATKILERELRDAFDSIADAGPQEEEADELELKVEGEAEGEGNE